MAASWGACDAVEAPPSTYATEVVTFSPGPGAGYGQSKLPGVVLGAPVVLSSAQGSPDVLSLGQGGEIVLGFGGRAIADGPGPDFVVFENAFFIGGDPTLVFAEAGEVSVSEDGATWHTFPCAQDGDLAGAGCAGWTPARPFDTAALPLDPAVTGADAFDLADVGLGIARFVRVRDLSEGGEAPSAGFDLDAVGVVHFAP
ncbi:MAG: cell surface protein [Myxococcota bacterium]